MAELTGEERLLLDNILDGLDDLFDRKPKADEWVWRLLVASRVALRASRWEGPIAEAAEALLRSMREEVDPEARYTGSLSATNYLRHLIAEVVSRLSGSLRSVTDDPQLPAVEPQLPVDTIVDAVVDTT